MKKWGTLITLSLAMFIIAIDAAIMNVSFSALVEDLNTTVSWVQAAVPYKRVRNCLNMKEMPTFLKLASLDHALRGVLPVGGHQFRPAARRINRRSIGWISCRT